MNTPRSIPLSICASLFLALLPSPCAADIRPEKVKATLPLLEKLIKETLRNTGVPGMAVAVVHKDEVVYLQGFGVREVGTPQSVDADTVFQLASISKPVATTVMSALVSERLIKWDDRVIDHDPKFRLRDPWVTQNVTLRDLLCHRSGLADHEGDLLEDLGYSREEVLHRLRYVRLANRFRADFAYTNFGFTEAAVAAARKTGKSWEELSAEKLYRPLGMKSTSSRHDDYKAAKNRAHLHVRINDKWATKYDRTPDAQSPAGGVSSSVRDMAQWMRLQLALGKFAGKQLIDEKALAETHRPQIISHIPANASTDRAGFYGLGWNVNYDDKGRVRLSHSGAFALGAATTVSLVPSEQLGIIVLTNGYPMGIPEAVCASYLDLVFVGKSERDWTDIYKKAFIALSAPTYGTTVDYSKPMPKKQPPLALSAYVGTYSNRYYGSLEVIEKSGSLYLRMGTKKTPFLVRHWDRDGFYYQPKGEMAEGLSAVTFVLGPNRKALQVVIENLNAQGQGAFSRVPSRKKKG